jgi:signal transduction histidine kinase
VSRQLRRDLAEVTDYYAALLRTADEQSRQADAANRVKDEFLTTLSHELRTPLNSVLGWAWLLAGGKLDPTQTAHAVQAIERAGWAQSRLIEDLLDLSRMLAGTMELSIRPTALQPLVESAVESLRSASDAKHLTVETVIDPSPRSRSTPSYEAGVEPVVNAISTPSSGHVEVRVVAEADQVRLTVSTPIGFPPAVAAHLFERFRQGDVVGPQHGGLGLGAASSGVVGLHGGSVFASSGGDTPGPHSKSACRSDYRGVRCCAEAQPAPALLGRQCWWSTGTRSSSPLFAPSSRRSGRRHRIHAERSDGDSSAMHPTCSSATWCCLAKTAAP